MSPSQVVAAESDADALGKLDWSGMEVETYVAAYNQSDWRDQARKARFKDPIQGGLEAVRMWGQQCDLLLSDQPLTARLKVMPALFSAIMSLPHHHVRFIVLTFAVHAWYILSCSMQNGMESHHDCERAGVHSDLQELLNLDSY